MIRGRNGQPPHSGLPPAVNPVEPTQLVLLAASSPRRRHCHNCRRRSCPEALDHHLSLRSRRTLEELRDIRLPQQQPGVLPAVERNLPEKVRPVRDPHSADAAADLMFLKVALQELSGTGPADLAIPNAEHNAVYTGAAHNPRIIIDRQMRRYPEVVAIHRQAGDIQSCRIVAVLRDLRAPVCQKGALVKPQRHRHCRADRGFRLPSDGGIVAAQFQCASQALSRTDTGHRLEQEQS